MTYNDIFRNLRYIFNFNDKKVIDIFALAGHKVSREVMSAWLKKEEDPGHRLIKEQELSQFLDGLIIDKRGKKEEGVSAAIKSVPAKALTNNAIFMKLKIALNLQSDDVLEILITAGMDLSPHELSAFFRKPDHKHYRECKDQILRNFIQGLKLKYRDKKFATGATPSDTSAHFADRK